MVVSNYFIYVCGVLFELGHVHSLSLAQGIAGRVVGALRFAVHKQSAYGREQFVNEIHFVTENACFFSDQFYFGAWLRRSWASGNQLNFGGLTSPNGRGGIAFCFG